MTKTVLITGYETKLGKALSRKYHEEETSSILLPVSPTSTKEQNPPSSYQFYDWIYQDTFSSRHILRKALREISTLDMALILLPSAEEIKRIPSFKQASFLHIEEAFNHQCKAYILLLKVLYTYFQNRQFGRICFILQEKETDSNEWDLAFQAFLKTFWTSLLENKENQNTIWGIISGKKSPEIEARFIYETLLSEKKSPGKWLHASEFKQTLMKILKS